MEKPRLVTLAVIVDKDKVLLVKRAKEPFKGHWSFISGLGGFERKGNPKEVIKDEVRYDINCEYNPEFMTYLFNEEENSIIFIFHGNIEGKPEINQKEVSELKWFSFEEIKDLKLAFEGKKVFDGFLRFR